MIPVSVNDHAQQGGLRLDAHVEPALERALLQLASVAVVVDRRGASSKLGLAVQPVAAQVHQSAAALVHPRLDAEYICRVQYSGWVERIRTL